MKKIIIPTLMAAFISLFSAQSVLANQHIILTKPKAKSAALDFSPQFWTSANTKDVITITNSTFNNYAVQISLSNGSGINIDGCSPVKHVNAHSSVVCSLGPQTSLVFSADGEMGSSGTYQIG